MTKADAFQHLRQKVQTGILEDETDGGLSLLARHRETPSTPLSVAGWRDEVAMAAYTGSLDAALALHESVLIGYHWSLHQTVGRGKRTKVYLEFASPKASTIVTEDRIPSRAWLLAIIDALILAEQHSQ